MRLKYYSCADGQKRTSIRALVRLTHEEVATCEAAAKEAGETLEKWLNDALADGIRDALPEAPAHKEDDEGKEGET